MLYESYSQYQIQRKYLNNTETKSIGRNRLLANPELFYQTVFGVFLNFTFFSEIGRLLKKFNIIKSKPVMF